MTSLWQKQRNWWTEALWKPKKPLSLDQLKFQHHMLMRNPVVTEGNKLFIVETFRSIAEILIWGDQNDSRVFDFFLEKNMQEFFLKTLSQNCGRFVCLQLLQTLSILFENIRNETSIYYLLSNNHVNSVIVLKLDFSDEEVLAYYISFLKTLSFKLNKHTIHFFYNEHLRDFPLYTEAIKFFNHPESMVRIAVRTLTLNVYKVDYPPMLEYIRNKAAAPYFSNLTWFIGSHIIELDECLLSQAHHLNRNRLESLVAEHLDHLHYISDILSLEVGPLNDVLSDHLLNRLLIPLYVYSLSDHCPCPDEENPRISSTISLFLLAQVFLIITHPGLVTPLAYLILTGDTTLSLPPSLQHTTGHRREGSHNSASVRGFIPPEASLTSSLSPLMKTHSPSHPVSVQGGRGKGEGGGADVQEGSSTESQSHMREASPEPGAPGVAQYTDRIVDSQYVLIEASPPTKEMQPLPPSTPSPTAKHKTGEDKKKKGPPRLTPLHGIPIVSTVFLDTLMGSLSVRSDDSRCLFSLCLLFAIGQNKGVHPKLLEAFSLKPPPQVEDSPKYNSELVFLLLSVLDTATASGNSIRLVTLRLTIMLLHSLLAESAGGPSLQDHHIALIESIYESSILQLRLFYKGPGDEIFLDMFEDEYSNEQSFQVKVPFLLQDACLLLPPTDTPLSGIKFTRRLPCGETERARKAMRVFFAIRVLSQQLSHSEEKDLPLTMPANSAVVGDIVDLNNCDLVACSVISADKTSHHFMVVTETEFLLVDPDKTKLGWGVVHFIAFLQDVDISPDPADSCALYLTVHNHRYTQKRPALSAKFQYEDHIRCVAARQCLFRNREHLRLAKMARIAKLLHLPPPDLPLHSSHTLPIQSSPRPDRLPTESPSPLTIPSLPIPSHPLTSQLSQSMVQSVFMPPSSTPHSTTSQDIEMNDFAPSPPRPSTEELPSFDSQVKLIPPVPDSHSHTTQPLDHSFEVLDSLEGKQNTTLVSVAIQEKATLSEGSSEHRTSATHGTTVGRVLLSDERVGITRPEEIQHAATTEHADSDVLLGAALVPVHSQDSNSSSEDQVSAGLPPSLSLEELLVDQGPVAGAVVGVESPSTNVPKMEFI